MSIDFLELLKLRLQFPWLVMPSTTPFTTGIPKDPDEVPPVVVRPGPPGGIGQDVKGKQPEQPRDQRTPQQKRKDEEEQRRIDRELEPIRKKIQEDRERRERELEDYKKIHPPLKAPKLDETEADRKRSEVFRRLMEQKVIIGPPQRPGTPQGGGALKAGASTDDAGEEERPSSFRWKEWSPSVIPLEEILGHATDPEERQRLLEQAGITDEFLEDFPTGSLPSFITDYLAGGRKIPESEEGQTNIYDLLKGDVSAGDVDVDLPEHEVRAGLGEEIPLKDAKEFDPDDFISDFLESRNIGPQRDPMQRLGDIIAENQKKLDDPEAWWNKRDTYVELDPDEAKKKAAINPYLYPESQGPSSIPELDILREQQARLEQDGRSSINRWFGQNVFDRDPETEKLLDSKDQSGITDEAELFLRTMADRYMESGKHKPEEEPSDIMDRIWKYYQQGEKKSFDQQHWGSLSDEEKSDLIETEWFLILEAAIYGQPPETNYFVQQGIDPPEWVVPSDREVAKQEFRLAPDAAAIIDKRWAKLSESIQGWVSGFSNYQLAQHMDGWVTKIIDETNVKTGFMEVGEKWMKDVFEDSVFREVTNRFDDIMKRTTPPPLSGASGVTEYTTKQFPFGSVLREEMDSGMKSATWRDPGTYISKHAKVGDTFHYETIKGERKIYRITDIIEEKRWENVSKRYKEEGFPTKEALAQVHKDMLGMSKARWDQQSELFKGGKGIWHNPGKTIVFEEATDLTDELTNLGAPPKPKPQEPYKPYVGRGPQELKPGETGGKPSYVDDEGIIHLSDVPSLKDLPEEDQDPKLKITEGPTVVEKRTGEVSHVYWGQGENKEFSNVAPRPFNYGGEQYYSVEHAYQTWKNGTYNAKIHKHPGWRKPGSTIEEKNYPSLNTKEKHIGRLADGTEVTLPANVDLMYNLVRDSMMQNSEVLKKFLESSGTFPAVDTARGLWRDVLPAVLEGVWKELRAIQPVVTVNVAGNREWKTPKHKEIMRKTLRAIKEDIEGNGYRMKVISGVQVGADQMGLDIAKELGLEIGGWAPMEWIVDGRETGKWQDPSLEQKYPGVKEFTGGGKFQDAGERYTRRTEQNVRSADFTIQFTIPERSQSPGAQAARKYSIAEGKKLYDNPDVSVESRFRRGLRAAKPDMALFGPDPVLVAKIKAEISSRIPGRYRK